MSKKELERRSYSFDISAEETESGNVITGRPIVYNSRTDLGLFDEVIMPGALDNTDLKDVRFLVNHDTSKIPLARSRRNNGNSTMKLSVDAQGMQIRVTLDTENNAEARALYSAVQRGDISGMSFMFGVDQEEWENLNSEHPTRNIRSISSVVEVSAVTFPAYEATEINARSKEALDNARSAMDKAKEKNSTNDLELEKLKTRTLLMGDNESRYNHNHDSKGKFSSGGGGGGGAAKSGGSSGGKRITNPASELSTGDKITYESKEWDGTLKQEATVTEVGDDYVIAKTDDGTTLWLDTDTVDESHKVYKK